MNVLCASCIVCCVFIFDKFSNVRDGTIEFGVIFMSCRVTRYIITFKERINDKREKKIEDKIARQRHCKLYIVAVFYVTTDIICRRKKMPKSKKRKSIILLFFHLHSHACNNSQYSKQIYDRIMMKILYFAGKVFTIHEFKWKVTSYGIDFKKFLQ